MLLRNAIGDSVVFSVWNFQFFIVITSVEFSEINAAAVEVAFNSLLLLLGFLVGAENSVWAVVSFNSLLLLRCNFKLVDYSARYCSFNSLLLLLRFIKLIDEIMFDQHLSILYCYYLGRTIGLSAISTPSSFQFFIVITGTGAEGNRSTS